MASGSEWRTSVAPTDSQTRSAASVENWPGAMERAGRLVPVQVEVPEIWVVQRCLAHYRVPVFDRLAVRLAERGFALKVVFDPGELEGPADTSRPYCDPFIRLDEIAIRGTGGWKMSGLLDGIRSRRPVAVIVEGMPRILTNFRLPVVTRSVGGVPLAWVKGHISEGTSEGGLFNHFRHSDFARRRFLARFDGVICYGLEGKRELERLGIPCERITVARNTIDTARVFDQLDDREEMADAFKRDHGFEGRRIVLSCGTMYRKKRHLDLVEAWPAIHAEHPDAALVLVGGGEMFEAVKQRVDDLDDGSIRLIGRVPDGQDYQWIGACDVSVMCGGLGLAIQQTLAFGRPMVVADESGVDGEIVQDGVTGWRYPRGDVNALANVVSAVLADPSGSAEIARRGQDLVRTEVNIDGMVKGFIEALERAGALQERN